MTNNREGRMEDDVMPSNYDDHGALAAKTLERLREIRRAFADYVRSEGCSCCRDDESHEEASKRLAKLLNVPTYKDGSGFDFRKYATKKGDS